MRTHDYRESIFKPMSVLYHRGSDMSTERTACMLCSYSYRPPGRILVHGNR